MSKKYRLNRFILEVEDELRKSSFENQYFYENQYLLQHNNVCPLCKKNIKINYKNVLLGIDLVGLIYLEKEKVALSYVLCNTCSKKLRSGNQISKEEIKYRISTHILDTIRQDK